MSLLTKFQLWWYMHKPKSIETELNGILITFCANCPPQYPLAEDYDCNKTYLPACYIYNFLQKLRPDLWRHVSGFVFVSVSWNLHILSMGIS